MPLKHTKAHLYTRFPKTLSDVFKAETTTTTKGDYPPKAAIIYFEVWREKRKKEKKEKKLYTQQYLYSEIHCKLWQLKSNNSSKLREDEQQFWNVL